MNYKELHNALDNFNVKYETKNREPLYNLRKEFINKFPIKDIQSLKIDDYVEGKKNTDSFCYWIEWKLDGLGKITGTPAIKFGIYYSSKKGRYCFTQKYGTSSITAFNTIRDEIISLLESGKKQDIEAIVNNPISPMFKGKILAVYFPQLYLNIFSEKHLDHFLKILDLDNETIINEDPIIKRLALIDYKNNNKEMANWTNDIFATFLYRFFHPDRNIPEDERFPTTDKYEYIDFDIDDTKQIAALEAKSEKRISSKPDYELEARKSQKYGDYGEKIVIKAEIDRLTNVLKYSKKKATKIVERISNKSDSYGYDIKSINNDGSTRYIEVKATTGKVGDVSFYYTENEIQTAKELGDNYFLYIVYDILSDNPKIWMIKNPILYNNLAIRPIKYRVSIHTKKKL